MFSKFSCYPKNQDTPPVGVNMLDKRGGLNCVGLKTFKYPKFVLNTWSDV